MHDRAIIGDAPRRREDARFVSGRGAYLDDLRFDGLAHAVFVRSPHAHARIAGINRDGALASAGVLAVLGADDAAADGLSALRPSVEANVQTNEPFLFMAQPLLADGVVRYVGEPVMLVVAELRNAALDAAERLVIDYEPLQAVTHARDALRNDAPLLSDRVPGIYASIGPGAKRWKQPRRSGQPRIA